MKATVKEWGNSAAVRIPASVMESTRLHLDDDVDVSEDRGRIIIQPVRHRSYRLEDLLRGINAKNLPELVDSGPPLGKEIWWMTKPYVPEAASRPMSRQAVDPRSSYLVPPTMPRQA